MQDTNQAIIQDANVPLPPQQIEKIVDENGEAYRRDVFRTAWKIRTQALWTGGALGIFFGTGIGALTALSTLSVGVSLASVGAMMLPVMGTFAVAGMVIGVAAFALTGNTIGGQVGAEKINDRKKLLKNPSEELRDNLKYHGTTQEKKTLLNRIFPFTQGSEELFNWRAGLTLGLAGLAVGGLLAATGGAAAIIYSALPGVAHALGLAAGVAIPAKIVTCMSLTACTLNGAFFGVDIPTIGANMQEFVAGIYSGKSFKRSKETTPELIKALAATTQPQPDITYCAQKTGPVFTRTSSTLISPIGAYAGEKPGKHVRMLAEQKFKAMQLSGEATIN